MKRINLNIELEKVDWKSYQPFPVFGVDEVGRGCLAGPVYAAAVCLNNDELSDLLTDSKKLSEKRREYLMPLIESNHWAALGIATVDEIDQLNIHQASLLAMKRAVFSLEEKMKKQAGHILVDGSFLIPGLQRKQTALIKGDLRCSPISAASIFAKVSRDHLMKELGVKFPVYGFEKHKGYASPTHKKAIADSGPCLHHRKSFSGVKEFISRQEF